MKLIGTCQNEIKGFNCRSNIEFDLKEQTITVHVPAQDHAMLSVQRDILKQKVRLRDIQVFSRAAVFECRRFPAAFLSSATPGGYSVDDGLVNKILDLNENNCGILTLGVTLRRGRISFRITPLSGNPSLRPELVLTNHAGHFVGTSFPVRFADRAYTIRYAMQRQFLTGRSTEKEREIMRHTSALISLSPERVIASLNPPSIALNYYWHEPKGYGERLFAREELPSVYQRLVDVLSGCSGDVRKRRFNEISLIVSGFDQSLLLEDRLANLYRALESFDGTTTLSANRLSKMFAISGDDTRFICELRNGLVHKGMTISDAVLFAKNKLASRSHVSLSKFKNVGTSQSVPWRMYLTVARMVVYAFFSDLNAPKPASVFPKARGY